MVKKISAGIITVFDGNETDPGGETLQAQYANHTSSEEKPYKFMVLILQVQSHQDRLKGNLLHLLHIQQKAIKEIVKLYNAITVVAIYF